MVVEEILDLHLQDDDLPQDHLPPHQHEVVVEDVDVIVLILRLLSDVVGVLRTRIIEEEVPRAVDLLPPEEDE